MKKLFLLIIGTLMATNAIAQKGQTQFALFGGYENFPELRERNGYDLGIELKHYVHDRVFVAANFQAGINDGDQRVAYTSNKIDYDFNLHNSVRDYMLGIGLGADLLHSGKHKIYAQGTVGLGSSDIYKDEITIVFGSKYDIVEPTEEKSTRFAVSASAGYDFQINRFLAVGVNYTGWQIGYEYKNSVNAKLSFIF